MIKEDAEKIMSCLVKAQSLLSDAAEIIETFKDNDELLAFRNAIATVVGTNFGTIILPIIQQYPELNPYPGSITK